MMLSPKNLNDYFQRKNIPGTVWLLLYALLLLPPALVFDISSGLDPSWQISLELAAKNHLWHGRDYAFTFGPLGFFITKLAIAHSKWFILLFELFIISCTIYALKKILTPARYPFYLCLSILFSFFLYTGYSCEMLMMPTFVCFLYFFITTNNLLALLLALFLSVISFYMKVNYGIVLTAFLYFTLVFALIRRTILFPIFFAGITLHISLLILLSHILEVDISSYVQASLSFIDSYNDAMFTYINAYDPKFIFALLIVILYPIGFIYHWKHYLSNFIALYFYLINGLFLYLLFKNGFVRADGHVFGFFSGVSVIFGNVYLISSGISRKIWGVFFNVALIISFYILIHESALDLNDLKSKTFIRQYCYDVFHDVSHKNTLTNDNRVPYKISPAIIEKIDKGSVDIIPFEISEIYYNNLRYNPRPIPQSYGAYNEFLDSKNARKYASANAPDYIIYDNISINQRHPFWDESITKRTLLTHYVLTHGDTSMIKSLEFDEDNYLRIYADIKESIENGFFKSGYEHFSYHSGREEGRMMNNDSTDVYLLFKKRAVPLSATIIKEETDVLEIGKEYTIEKTDNPLYLYADIKYSIAGKIKRFLFQPSPIDVILYCEDGTAQRFAAIQPILKTGVLINKKVDTRAESLLFFLSKGVQNKNIVKLKFVANEGYEDKISVTFREMTFE